MIPLSLAPLLNHLWQSTLFAVAAGFLTLALRRNPARARHWVWVMASFKFLVPFSLLVALGSQLPWRAAGPPAKSEVLAALDQATTLLSVPSPDPVSVARTAPASPSILPFVLASVWACGFLAIGVSCWTRWRRIDAAVRTGSPIRLAVPMRAVCSPSFLEPGVFGVFRPVLLLPEGILDHLTPEQLDTVVAHELCHVRHRDNLIGVVQMFVEAVFWFHPPVWWVGKQILHERERACDEEVLQLGNQPRAYAQGILTVCELYLKSPVKCVAGVSGSHLPKRIEAILNHRVVRQLTGGRKLLLAGAGVVALIGPVALGVLNLPALRAQISPDLRFDVASIRPAQVPDNPNGVPVFPTEGGIGTSNPLRISYRGTWIKSLIAEAFGVRADQISGVPKEIANARFDITANIPQGSTKEQFNIMLGNLLRDRFHLRFHMEQKAQPVYALRVGKNGSKLKETNRVDGAVVAPPGGIGAAGADGFPVLPPNYKGMVARPSPDGIFVAGQDVSIAEIKGLFEQKAGRPIVDETGLAGRYDVKVHFEWISRTPAATPGTAPSIFTAVDEQLGLKLESATLPLDHLVVDSIDPQPTEN